MERLPLSLSRAIRNEASWYRGDFHAHTHHSDGSLSPGDLLQAARDARLDFLAITDHNTVSAFSHVPRDSSVLVLPGIEITADAGHFNVFGITQRSEWMRQVLSPENRFQLGGAFKSFSDLMAQTSQEGMLNSMNHPFLKPWEWQDNATELSYLQCVEVWNDPNWPGNDQANAQTVAFWTELLNAGYRITAIGGSDFHGVRSPERGEPPEALGLPATYVYAKQLSGRSVLQALREQRVYISAGPRLSLEAEFEGQRYGIGSQMEALAGEITIHAAVTDAPDGAFAWVIANGATLAEAAVSDHQVQIRLPVQPEAGGISWIRLDVTSCDGALLALTNPIFLITAPPPTRRKTGDFDVFHSQGMVQ